jgi:glycosyltransferase involved in cell wall biosynthesis
MRQTFLILSQVYVPDPASVGQHMAGAAAELARRGHRVIVLTSDRGYDEPSRRYPAREVLDGVHVRRMPWCSFGKGSMLTRLLGALSFLFQACMRGLFVRNVDIVVVSTSPPMAAAAGIALARARRAGLKLWVMDLNPDQTIALGLTRATSVPARLFEAMNRMALEQAETVVVLDRFMAARVCGKRDVRDKLVVLPPWPLEDEAEPVPHEANPFRRTHGLNGKRVVMYSGNHSPSNPITTLLAAAEQVGDDPRLQFLFVGGGAGKQDVEASTAPNVRSLPYQPLAELWNSLSAADVHAVTMGDAMVGIVHPCKVYGALAVGRPVLLFGPDACHVSDIIEQYQVGWRVRHGDVDGAVRILRGIAALSNSELAELGRRARAAARERFGKQRLCGALVDALEARPASGLPRLSTAPDRAAALESR